MHLCAFIAILVPKLVAVVTPLCSLSTGVSQTNSPISQTLSHNQTLHGYVAYNQWLKYKFGVQELRKNIGALLSTEGALLNLRVPLTAVWGPGTFASNL